MNQNMFRGFYLPSPHSVSLCAFQVSNKAMDVGSLSEDIVSRLRSDMHDTINYIYLKVRDHGMMESYKIYCVVNDRSFEMIWSKYF